MFKQEVLRSLLGITNEVEAKLTEAGVTLNYEALIKEAQTIGDNIANKSSKVIEDLTKEVETLKQNGVAKNDETDNKVDPIIQSMLDEIKALKQQGVERTQTTIKTNFVKEAKEKGYSQSWIDAIVDGYQVEKLEGFDFSKFTLHKDEDLGDKGGDKTPPPTTDEEVFASIFEKQSE